MDFHGDSRCIPMVMEWFEVITSLCSWNFHPAYLKHQSTSIGLRWCTRLLATLEKMLLGNLHQILKLENVGATTDSSGLTFWPLRVFSILNMTPWFSTFKFDHRPFIRRLET